MFIFPMTKFVHAVRQADRVQEEPARWYVHRKWGFDVLTPETAFEVTEYYRNLRYLDPD